VPFRVRVRHTGRTHSIGRLTGSAGGWVDGTPLVIFTKPKTGKTVGSVALRPKNWAFLSPVSLQMTARSSGGRWGAERLDVGKLKELAE